jgi:hypothetical protein
MDASHIDAFLSVLQRRAPENWRWVQRAEGRYWIVRYTGCCPPCTFHIEVGPALICFHAALKMQVWAECRLAVYRYALRLNEEMAGAKFGLSYDGQLSLMVEWPCGGLTFASFETAVQTLLACYGAYCSDVRLVAQDADLARHLATRELEAQDKERALEKAVPIQVESC